MDEPNQQSGLALCQDPGTLDAHGFDPADYKWIPVLRRPRKDGWTPQRQVDFIAALADSGCVAEAARRACMSVNSCYRLRRSPGAENFARAWDAAMSQAARRLVDLAFDRAINGSDEPLFDREGHRIGSRMRHNDRLLMFLLRAYMPERFRHAHLANIAGDEDLPPLAEPVAQALLRLEPVTPADPHLRIPAEELALELECADIGGGVLPHWHRGGGELDPPSAPLVDEQFERLLANAKWEPRPPQGEANGASAKAVLD